MPRSNSRSVATNASSKAQSAARIRAPARKRWKNHRISPEETQLLECVVILDRHEKYSIHYPGSDNNALSLSIPSQSLRERQKSPPDQQNYEFPSPIPEGGQIFANTLLLSFSCMPRQKQQVLESLRMSDGDLASFRTVIAAIWDEWNEWPQIHRIHINFVQLPLLPLLKYQRQ
ncbi:hypothetical protein BT96DRAFT_968954 [Gymnopus androsaceus JB14]|uniref:Uncharacterized protein n=1 Tax=Gymnopus androsaceus JB14 TaxID=1447944 RepID=A0A6A4IQN5_9AGAR|nr:hypothetical protein BT96DRAFT_968954 [Gymnopus androsaceus JB14]